MADYTKFKAYWESIGKPMVETRSLGDDKWLLFCNPNFNSHVFDYRIKDDPHWKLRKKWVDSDFTLLIESKSESLDWGPCPRPIWYSEFEYREIEQKPMTDKPKQYRQRCGRPGGIYEWNANPGADYPHNGWYENKDGEKVADSFSANLKYSLTKDMEEDLIEITPYDGIAIDTPGWAVYASGDKEKRHFAGIHSCGKPMVWDGGLTSWSNEYRHTCEDFIPKGAGE